jgi:hypothetical protein
MFMLWCVECVLCLVSYSCSFFSLLNFHPFIFPILFTHSSLLHITDVKPSDLSPPFIDENRRISYSEHSSKNGNKDSVDGFSKGSTQNNDFNFYNNINNSNGKNNSLKNENNSIPKNGFGEDFPSQLSVPNLTPNSTQDPDPDMMGPIPCNVDQAADALLQVILIL